MALKRFFDRAIHITHWMWRGKFHILSVIFSILTILYLTKSVTFHPNIVALVLSLAGLVIILAQQILDAREFADRKPNTFLNWIKSYPRAEKIVFGVGRGVFASAGMKAHGSVSIANEASLERKVEFLIRQFSSLESAIARVEDRVDEVRSMLKSTETDLKNSIADLSASITSIISGHVVGAYDINLFGITITICGTLIQFFSV